MFVYRVRVQGDTYGEYDGDILIELAEKCDALNKDLLIEYSGEFEAKKIFAPYISEETSFAYKTAEKGNKVWFVGRKFSSVLKKAPEKLVNRTIVVNDEEVECLEKIDSSEEWTIYSNVDELNNSVEKGYPEIFDIRNSVSIFVGKSESWIVFTECGVTIKKRISNEYVKEMLHEN